MDELETLQEKLGVLRAMLIHTASDGFDELHDVDQQAYLAHCAELAVEAAKIANTLARKALRPAA